jgi:hypothetical protein
LCFDLPFEAAVRERLEEIASDKGGLLNTESVLAISDEDIRKYFGAKRRAQDSGSFDRLIKYLTEEKVHVRIRNTNNIVEGVLWTSSTQVAKYLHVGRTVLYDVTHNTNKFDLQPFLQAFFSR